MSDNFNPEIERFKQEQIDNPEQQPVEPVEITDQPEVLIEDASSQPLIAKGESVVKWLNDQDKKNSQIINFFETRKGQDPKQIINELMQGHFEPNFINNVLNEIDTHTQIEK